MITCPNCGFESPSDLNYCGRCGVRLNPDRARGPGEVQPLKGEMRLVTVLMADISGSTDLLETLGTEQWVTLMNELLQALGGEVYRLGGVVDQFRGDGLVAFFGTKEAHEDDSERAVLAALAMQEIMAGYRQSRAENENLTRFLQLRVGIHTGEVIVAQIGDERLHQEDTAMGRAIALASRLETQADPGAIWVSGTTYEAIRSRFDWTPIGAVKLRGFSETIEVFQPLGHKLEEFPAIQQTGHSLLGRRRELFLLTRAVSDLQQFGRGGLITLVGARGMGKSRLLQQTRLDRTYSRGADLTWLRGRCRSYEQATPFSMWLSALRRQFQVREGDPIENIQAKVFEQADIYGEPLVAEFAPWVSGFMGAPADESYLSARSGAQNIERLFQETNLARGAVERSSEELQRQTLFHEAKRYLRAFSRFSPLVIQFEDFQWADKSSIELLKYCLPLCRTQDILFIVSTRPATEGAAAEFLDWARSQYRPELLEIKLQPLKATESHKLIDDLIGPQTLPDPLQALLVDRAEGNPYFLQQLLQTLIQQGKLIREPFSGRWRLAGPVTSLDLPGSLQALLQVQIDALPLEARRLLQHAAVIGVSFWSRVLASVVDLENIDDLLTQLRRSNILEKSPTASSLGAEYRFISNLLRDVVYNSLLTRQRQEIHLKVGRALEEILGEEAPNAASILAHHFRQADRPEKELVYILSAAETAEQGNANQEGITLLSRAVEIINLLLEKEKDPANKTLRKQQLFQVVSSRRAIYERLVETDLMRRDAHFLLSLALELNDTVRTIDALLQQPGVSSWQNETELQQGMALARQALDLSLTRGDLPRQMNSLIAIARQMRFVGDSKAVKTGEKALQLARKIGDRTAEVYMLIWLGMTYDWSDQTEKAQEYYELARPLSRTLNDKQAEIELLKQIGIRAEREGDYYRLLTTYLQRRRQLARLTGNRLAEAQAAMLQGLARSIYLGDLRAGLNELISGRRLWQGTGVEGIALVYIAHILILQGDLKAAQQALDYTQAQSTSLENDTVRIARALVQAMWHNEQQEITHWHNALGLAAFVDLLTEEKPLVSKQFKMAADIQAGIAHLGLAGKMVDDRSYHLERAYEFTLEAVNLYESFGYTQITECQGETVLYWHGQVLQVLNRQPDAVIYFEKAYREMMRKYELIPPTSHFRALFLENLPIHRLIMEQIERITPLHATSPASPG